MNLVLGLILVAIGVYSIVAAATNWEWFMSHRSAAPVVALFGRQGARVVYLVLGLLFISGGVELSLLK